MKVLFTEIPPEGLFLKINDESWFPEQEITRTAPVHAQVNFQGKGRDRVLMEGNIDTTISVDCDRCMKTFHMKLSDNFSVDLELVENGRQEPVEHDCTTEEMDAIYLNRPEIDVFQMLSQQAFLMVPEKKVCSEEC